MKWEESTTPTGEISMAAQGTIPDNLNRLDECFKTFAGSETRRINCLRELKSLTVQGVAFTHVKVYITLMRALHTINEVTIRWASAINNELVCDDDVQLRALGNLLELLEASFKKLKADLAVCEFENFCEIAGRECTQLAESCKEKAEEEEIKETLASKVMETTASKISGGVTTGVGLSILAGIFTFGIGTAVAVGAVAAAATVANAALEKATDDKRRSSEKRKEHKEAQDRYNEAARTFHRCKLHFKELCKFTTESCQYIEEARKIFEDIVAADRHSLQPSMVTEMYQTLRHCVEKANATET